MLHIRFVCASCARFISGCPRACKGKTHKIEKVECCAYCARGETPPDEKPKTSKQSTPREDTPAGVLW
jgi:hypothetical protein